MTLLSQALNLDEDSRSTSQQLSGRAPLFEQARGRSMAEADERGTAESGVPSLALAVLADAIECRATDIHVDPDSRSYRLRFRIDGVLHTVATGEPDEGQRLINQFRVMSRVDPTETPIAEGRWTSEVKDRPIDVRTTFISTIAGDKMAARVLNHQDNEFQLSDLGLSQSQYQQVMDWLATHVGMTVVAGPTGSGKTALLYALVRQLNSPQANVMTLEDPVEVRIPHVTQIEVDEEKGLDFAAGVKSILRLDPDFVAIGETRDQATAEAAVTAANSGCGLLTSMHGDEPASVVTNLRYWELADAEIAAALRLVISGRLVRKLCDECSTHGNLSETDRRWLESHRREASQESPQPVGCKRCDQSGYVGRVGIYSVWYVNSEQTRKIRDGVDAAELSDPSQSLIEVGLQKVRDGVTTIAELRRAGLPRPR